MLIIKYIYDAIINFLAHSRYLKMNIPDINKLSEAVVSNMSCMLMFRVNPRTPTGIIAMAKIIDRPESTNTPFSLVDINIIYFLINNEGKSRVGYFMLALHLPAHQIADGRVMQV